MNRVHGWIKVLSTWCVGLLGALFFGQAGAVSGAISTTTDLFVDGPTAQCLNGPPGDPVNCNIYSDKRFVWLSGLPVSASLGAGTYFFAVLDPGGQANPNDCTASNLSDTTPCATTATGAGDTYQNRIFDVDATGHITYPGTGGLGGHNFDPLNNKLNLYGYDDTTNPGGVYILAVCKIEADLNPVKYGSPGVTPSDCKYDAFKVQSNNQQEGGAQPPTVTKDATGAFTDTWKWGITKSVDNSTINTSSSAKFNYTVSVTHDGGTDSNITVSGTISVFNPNVDGSNATIPVTLTSVSDALSDGTTCSVDTSGGLVLNNAETDFPYTCNLSSVPADPLNNVVTITWADQTLSTGALAAGTATFEFDAIFFNETKVDDCVNVTDSLKGSLGTVCQSDPSPKDFTYPLTFNDPAGTCTTHNNTASFTTDTNNSTGTANASVKVCVGADLKVSKTANPAFKRTFKWGITKKVDKTFVEQLGGTVTFNYTVSVTHDSGTDSNWTVTGTITVTNPNDWEAITYNLSDSIGNGDSCSIDGGGTGLVVAAGATVYPTYTCTYASAPSPLTGTNTAIASWDKAAFYTPDASAKGTAAANFGNPTTLVDACVKVTDPLVSGGTLGTVCNTDPSPKTFTYSNTVTVPTDKCTTVNNTATFTSTTSTTTGSDSKSVQVCGPVAGGLTMGFWSNKNGQGIITGGGSTGGVCNSATWLRLLAPFQDLSATATCAQVGTYVLNVIKSGNTNCSGATCNPMLKAQMLSTALDVYFSDPTLGGNKISAPLPIGGVKVDLKHICQMIDGSGGVGTCSGKTEDASSAFGGSSCLSVSNMLTSAASQSNSGGSVWYGQVKATQVLAKDSFDSINNAVAFSCGP